MTAASNSDTDPANAEYWQRKALLYLRAFQAEHNAVVNVINTTRALRAYDDVAPLFRAIEELRVVAVAAAATLQDQEPTP